MVINLDQPLRGTGRIGALNEGLLAQEIRRNGDTMLPASLDNFSKVFAIGPEDRVLMLADRDLDHRVTEHVAAFARGRGAAFQVLTVESHGNPSGGNSASKEIPKEIESLLTDWATFVVSTWFASVVHPLAIKLRRTQGQRWVKITFFRDWDYLRLSAAAFPLDVISLLLRKTAALYPRGVDVDVHISDPRGSDLHIKATKNQVDSLLSQSRWQGEVTADAPGCYIHYIPTHGPNLIDEQACEGEIVDFDGTLIPQWAVGFNDYFSDPPVLTIEHNVVTSVKGGGTDADVLETMLIGSKLIELGCGHNPKWPLDQVYPAGSNAPGSLHFGMDLTHEDEYIQKMLPKWPEPPVHMDLIVHDSTVHFNETLAIKDGLLQSLRDPEVQALASRYGNPITVLEGA